KPESSAESATQRLSSAVGGRNAAVFHDSVARHAHAARTGDVLIEAGRARLHVDVAGTGDIHIGFLGRGDGDIAAAGDMNVGTLDLGVIHPHRAGAGNGKL